MPRFEAKIDFTEDGQGCWLWTAALNQDGYGIFQYATKDTRIAHRVAYELLVGPVPDGYQLDHVKEHCAHRNCVKVIAVGDSPVHLEPVLPAENIRRGRTGQWQSERAALKEKCTQGHDLAIHGYWLARKTGKGQWVCRECRREYERARRRGSSGEGCTTPSGSS